MELSDPMGTCCGSTHSVAKKYRLYPIYIPCPFLDVESQESQLYRRAYQVPSTIPFLRNVVTEFLPQDLQILIS
jgi:uncharacterized cysteine cluster protein YcgN (CxxCxxCC family)